MVYDSDRLRPVIQLSGALLLCLLTANLGLALLSAAFPGWLPHQFFGLDFVADNRQRAVAVAAQYRDGIVSRDERLVLVLGLSSASEGIQLETLRRADEERRYLGLCGAGRNMNEVALYAGPLLESDVRPGLVVFAISPFHLMDPLPLGEGFVNNLRQRESLVQLMGFWFYARRSDVKHAIETAVLAAQHALLDLFDVRFGETGRDPWREFVRMGIMQVEAAEAWQAGIRRYGLRGYYDPQAYVRSREQAASLVELVEQFQNRGSEVVIVLMPEHSSLRERIPPEAMDALLGPLDREFGDGSPSIVDLRESVSDSGFTDISHLNDEGRAYFSPLLAEAIRQ